MITSILNGEDLIRYARPSTDLEKTLFDSLKSQIEDNSELLEALDELKDELHDLKIEFEKLQDKLDNLETEYSK